MKTKKSKRSGVSLRAYARHRGVTLRAVQKARDSKRITVPIVDVETADREWERNTRQENRDVVEPSPESLSDARLRRERVKAELDELELARRRGDLVPAAAMIEATESRARAERDALLNWPGRISATLAAALKIPERRLRRHLDAAVREFLRERSSEILRKNAAA
jgi:hypothetical protein